jgi:formylglycine-generating enzyme required for sulfatase activity
MDGDFDSGGRSAPHLPQMVATLSLDEISTPRPLPMGNHLVRHRFGPGKSLPVRQKTPNNWGLYNMLGNFAEWCSDSKGAYPSGTVTDPELLNVATTARVVLGGFFVLGVGACRSAARFSSGPSDSGNGVGFRPVLISVR